VDLARGNPERARGRFELSLRINPAAGVRAYAITGIGLSYLIDGRAHEAFAFLREAYQFIPDYPVTLVGFCVAAGMTGQTAEASDAAERVRDTGALAAVTLILRDPQQRAMLELGLRNAERTGG
jgi:tetratricopeptide (TPR) repeat protein